MATETEKQTEQNGKNRTFTCKYCGKVTPFEEIVVVTDYFPAIVVCSECAKIVRI